jgi:S-adenosylmethionine hydrolase
MEVIVPTRVGDNGVSLYVGSDSVAIVVMERGVGEEEQAFVGRTARAVVVGGDIEVHV